MNLLGGFAGGDAPSLLPPSMRNTEVARVRPSSEKVSAWRKENMLHSDRGRMDLRARAQTNLSKGAKKEKEKTKSSDRT